MRQLVTARISGARITILLGVGTLLLIAAVECQMRLSSVLGGPTLPPGTTELKMANASQNVVTLPVHGQLLLRACKQVATSGDRDDKYDCDLGLLDLENERLVRLAHLEGERAQSEIVWSPDGMQFSYHNDCCMMGPYLDTTVIYRADGTEQYNLLSFDAGSWSADANYFIAWTCYGPHIDPGYATSVHDAVSWERLCAVCEGMTCANTTGLPTCSRPSDCLPEKEAPKEYESERYQAIIEDIGLRVVDSKTNTEEVYAMPGYRIMTIAWAPGS